MTGRRQSSSRRQYASGLVAGDKPLFAGGLLPSVVLLPLDTLVLNPANARKHSREQLHRLEACIGTYGFLVPVLIDEVRNVVLGHGRVAAARQLGMKEVPTLTVTGLSREQVRAFAIAENRLSDLATWDYDKLRIELASLIEFEVDIENTAFSTGEADIILDGGGHQNDRDDDLPSAALGPAVSRPGDLYLLGQHRLLCGDATLAGSYKVLLGDLKASVGFADPPYNVPIDGHVGGLGKVKHRDFPMAVGEMSAAEFTEFLETVFTRLAAYSHQGSIHFICMDWRHLREVLDAGYEAYTELKNVCVWNKDNAGMGSFYRSKHELVLVFQNGSGRFQNNVRLGASGRYRTNVWDYPGMTSIGKGRSEELGMHPTVKPLALVADAIRDCSRRNDLVLDPFAGSGTTILAAHRTGRVAAAIELDPLYVDVTIARWERATKIPATLAGSGQTFAEVRAERIGEGPDDVEWRGAEK